MTTDSPASSPNIPARRDYSADGDWRRAAEFEAKLRLQAEKQRQEKQAETDDAYLANLSPKQKEAIELAVQGHKDIQISKKISVSVRTLYRWKTDDPDYIRALDEARSVAHSSISDQYRSLLSRATGVFVASLRHEDMDIQFRAAHALLMMNGSFKPLPPSDEEDEADDGPAPPEEWVQESMNRMKSQNNENSENGE